MQQMNHIKLVQSQGLRSCFSIRSLPSGVMLLMMTILAVYSSVVAGQQRVLIPFDDIFIVVPVKTVFVDNLNDNGPGSLREAARLVPTNGTIEIRVRGTIKLTSGEIVVGRSATIIGTVGLVALDAGGRSRCMQTRGNLTAVNFGCTNGRAPPGDDGGGLLVSGDLTFTNGHVIGSVVTGTFADGGGIHAGGNVTINGSNILRNRVGDGDGGGIFSRGGNVTVNRSGIVNNQTGGGISRGGGIHTFFGDVTVDNSNISGNRVIGAGDRNILDGGGIYTFHGDVTVNSSTISNNLISASSGILRAGGIHTFHGDVTVNSSTISLNKISGGGSGGGVRGFHGAIIVNNSTISNNSASRCPNIDWRNICS